MVTEIISVGTEILLGNIVNTNSAYLSEMCARLGLSVYYESVVGDNEKRMAQVIKTALERSDVVILTGGLGPTEDDLTKEVTAQVMGVELKEDKHVRKRIEKYMEIYAKNHAGRKITANNWKQAMVPEGALVLENSNGTAPGLIIEKDGKTAILLPGPPNELKPLFEEQVYPYLRKRQPHVIYSQMVKIAGIGESQVADEIKDLIHSQTNPTIAPYAKPGEVHLRITAKADSEKEGKKLVKPLVRELKSRFGKNIYSTEENKSLEEAVVELLRDQNLTLSLAESCTGGAVAARIVNVPGASEVFLNGYVTYSNKAKRKSLLVKKSTLKKEGAVSEKCAKEMAKGGCMAGKTDLCLSVTGLAGPEGGTKETPVGTVYMGCCYRGKTTVQKFFFTGNRMRIREQAVTSALVMLRECIMDAAAADS
ncbi:MAG TPA: competence/damage-inducible protein A [Candidatus Blautia avistercoris]|uniref:competence/damage-inducible protein A n=1 Tax=Blautia sp. An249 TaxID=1965603 RepID=UPI000B3798FE|nr:competence/damage-inducible protein A [Blautia sp. An249]OUO80320.1 competence/damage-inducible protein A [Blautia sp. An249]HIY19812.1 competence/damage-inducible protein A [Candidatus Blautia avistercoris]